MTYRAVGNRIAVDPQTLKLSLSSEVILAKFLSLGFTLIELNPIELAKSQIGVAKYKRGAKPSEAPEVVDCTSFTKWIFGQCGIWLPRYSIQQRECGTRVNLNEIVAGDIVFRIGRCNYFENDPTDAVGHAGLATGQGTVIHAAGTRKGLIESTLIDFLEKEESRFRGAMRMIPKDSEVWFLEIPPDFWVETSDDLRWLLLQRM